MGKPVLSEVGKSAIVGFASRALPLSERSEADLWVLAELAVTSPSKSLKQCFSVLPTKEEIDEWKSGKYLNTQSDTETPIQSLGTESEEVAPKIELGTGPDAEPEPEVAEEVKETKKSRKNSNQ